MNQLSSHRRWNPLKKEWVLVSPHRTARPWTGALESVNVKQLQEYDSKCYLCSGNTRANGEVNPEYKTTYSFSNDFAALNHLKNKEDSDEASAALPAFIRSINEGGICKVICFSPRHDLTLAQMPPTEILEVIKLWQREYQDLSKRPDIKHIMIFENKGEIMGCSNPHPHGQIWAQNSIPTIAKRIYESQVEYLTDNSRTLLSEYITWEISQNKRIVYQNDSWVALVPFWAVWPYEVMLIPKRRVSNILELTDDEALAWSVALSEVLVRYDNLFKCSFPYSMGIYQATNHALPRAQESVHLYQSFAPPLLRSASIKKFMVGYELFGEAQRDITPESAASVLASLPNIHYLNEAISRQ